MPGDEQSVSGEVVDRAAGGGSAPLPRKTLGIPSIVLLCLIAFLPGFAGMPPSNQEGKYAQASRQVYESLSLPAAQKIPARHSPLTPRFLEQPSVGHGPAGHWLQAASAAVLSRGNSYRDALWMYRVPTLVAAFILLLLTRRLAESMFESGAARLAIVLLALCPLMSWSARQATTDMLAAACTLLGVTGLWGVMTTETPRRSSAALFWTAIALGTLLAGLLVPIVLLSTAAAVCLLSRSMRPWRNLRWLIGAPACAALVGAWMFSISSHASPTSVFAQMWAAMAWNGGWQLPGTHAALSLVLLWPGSLLLIPGAVTAWRLRDKNPAYLLLIAWIVPSWIILETMPGKSLTATLPLYPAVLILAARAVLAAEADALPGASPSPTRPGNILWLCIGGAIGMSALGLLAGRLILWPASTLHAAVVIAFAALSALIILKALQASWSSILKARWARAVIAGAGIMLVLNVALPTVALPHWLGLSRAVSAELDRIDPSGARPVATVDFPSDSLVFLTRGRATHQPSNTAGLWMASHPSGLLVGLNLREVSLTLKELGSAAGLDTFTWRAVRIGIEELNQ